MELAVMTDPAGAGPQTDPQPLVQAEGELLAGGRARWLGAVIWPSFFAACVMTVVFFAMVDPLELDEISALHLGLGRMAGYSLGFVMFWVATLSSSAFTLLLHGATARLGTGARR